MLVCFKSTYNGKIYLLRVIVVKTHPVNDDCCETPTPLMMKNNIFMQGPDKFHVKPSNLVNDGRLHRKVVKVGNE
jgi:hypothetical protein